MKHKIIKRDALFKNKPLIIAGPCSVESEEQLMGIAKKLKQLGITVMRAQLWKPRTTPDSFQGMGHEGLDWIKKVKEETGMLIATEIVSIAEVERTKGITDILWVGSRNMQNFELLKAIGKDPRPVILKNGFVATIKEWIGAAQYCGIDKTIMCERGIRTGADSTRFTTSINNALVIKHDYKMPVILDPSHSAGRRDIVPDLALAAIAAGLDGVVIETHEEPEKALSDADQQITPEVLAEIIDKAKKIYKVIQK
jgi:3-deoxy-7-phosphoheptulonate synthase